MGIPRAMLPRDPLLQRGLRRGARHGRSAGARSPASSATSRRRCSGRRCFDARRGQEHLRHRLVPAASTPARRSCAPQKLLTTRRLQARRRPADATCWRARSPSPGALIQWLRDRLKLIDERRRGRGAGAHASRTTAACTSCPPSPACSRRYWRDDARGVIVGLTAYANRGHIARAALEATAWQTREVVDAANAVADVPFSELRSTAA